MCQRRGVFAQFPQIREKPPGGLGAGSLADVWEFWARVGVLSIGFISFHSLVFCEHDIKPGNLR